jgi:hypothetical protein
MVDLSRVAVTLTPPIGPSSVERTSPVRAGALCAHDTPWRAAAEIPANRTAAKRFMRMVFSPVRTRAMGAGRDMAAAYREIVTNERRVTVSDGQAFGNFTDLILTSRRSGRLEGWQQVISVHPSFETALRASSG